MAPPTRSMRRLDSSAVNPPLAPSGFHRNSSRLWIAALLLLAAGCQDASGPAGDLEIDAGVVHVLPVDTTVQWTVAGSTSEEVVWRTGDPGVATVVDGQVTTHAAGTVRIEAEAGGVRGAVELRVVPRARGLLLLRWLGPHEEGPWSRLEFYDLETGELSTIAERARSEYLAPRYSPDGSRIAVSVAFPQASSPAYDLRTDIFVMAADGTGEEQLTAAGEYEHFESPSWSPDGSRIVFLHSTGEENSFTRRSPRIGIINADGSGLRYLGPGGRDPVWSPDGKYVLYGGPWAHEERISLMNPETGSVTRIPLLRPATCQDQYCFPEDADWSPDSNLLLLWGDQPTLVDVQTGDVGPAIAEESAAFLARMAPDGSAVAIAWRTEGSGNSSAGIRIFDLDGNPVLDLPLLVPWMDWRPGGERE